MIKKRSLLNSKKTYVVLLLAVMILSAVFWRYRQTIKRVISKELYSLINRNNKVCSCNWNSLELKRDDYKTKHLPGAIKSSNNLFIKNKRILKKQINSNRKDVELKIMLGLFYEEDNNSKAADKIYNELISRFCNLIYNFLEIAIAVLVANFINLDNGL